MLGFLVGLSCDAQLLFQVDYDQFSSGNIVHAIFELAFSAAPSTMQTLAAAPHTCSFDLWLLLTCVHRCVCQYVSQHKRAAAGAHVVSGVQPRHVALLNRYNRVQDVPRSRKGGADGGDSCWCTQI